jgi:cellulose synthase/poly-beta-1,6-N-acetylglucosamine synthase-like glycosyltransferase
VIDCVGVPVAPAKVSHVSSWGFSRPCLTRTSPKLGFCYVTDVSAPAVSLIMPVGAVDEFVPAQLDAIDRLVTTFPFEIIISLNSPDPAQKARLASLVSGATRPVRIVDSSDRRGASHARNAGAAAALAPVLAFCDSDDIVRPNWLERLVAGLEGYDVVGGHLEEFATSRWVRGVRPPATPGALPSYLGVSYPVSANMAIYRTWFEKVGGFDETLHRCEDIAIGWDLIRGGARLGFVADAIVDYRTRDGLHALLKQHYHYGRGMTEVLSRRGVPSVDGAAPVTSVFAANRQQGGKGSAIRFVRRSYIAVGRAHGLVTERQRRRSA